MIHIKIGEMSNAWMITYLYTVVIELQDSHEELPTVKKEDPLPATIPTASRPNSNVKTEHVTPVSKGIEHHTAGTSWERRLRHHCSYK